MPHYDIVIVGAGLSGAVIAERVAHGTEMTVLVIDKRPHIAGNCYDFINNQGILMNEYGAHLFHTNDKGVWDYVQQFSEWVRWDHRVVAKMGDGTIVPVPVNINTVNSLCGTHLQTIDEMKEWLTQHQEKKTCPSNSEEMAISRVGHELYEKLFKDYTMKQWGKDASQLDPSVLARIPVRDNWDDRYFTDKYQALPKYGYTEFVKNILDHPRITLWLSTDFFEVQKELSWKHLFFTGRIDQYFEGMEKLEYRSIRFETESFQHTPFFQVNSVVNYPENNVPFTRIVEYKHFLNQYSPHTTIVREYPSDDGEPYYPVPSPRNLELYEKYRSLAEKEQNVHFVGRLANYKYFNMDAAIRNALDLFEKIF